MDILAPDRGKMTIYGSDFQQVNLTPNGGVSPTGKTANCSFTGITHISERIPDAVGSYHRPCKASTSRTRSNIATANQANSI